ncbi:MAG TPA: c-type cytochrome [Nannocystaceae bacterium]|nr:c-type cytochrome [Nannocystaceae bacterium]
MRRGLVALVLVCGCRTPLAPEAARAEAKKIWDERCSNCHGARGHGDGPGAKLLPVRPRNLADQNWQSDADDERIAQVIVEGGQVLGLDSNMAANPDLRTKPEVVTALVELVRGL